MAQCPASSKQPRQLLSVPPTALVRSAALQQSYLESRSPGQTFQHFSGRRADRGAHPSTSSALNHEIRAASRHSCTSCSCWPTAARHTTRSVCLCLLSYLSGCLFGCPSSFCHTYISHSHIRRITAPSSAPGHGSRLMPLVPRASEEDTRVLYVVVLWPVPVTASGTPLSPTSQAFSRGPSAKQQRAANLEEAKESRYTRRTSDVFQNHQCGNFRHKQGDHGFCTFPPEK
jgi:hypothetical protein